MTVPLSEHEEWLRDEEVRRQTRGVHGVPRHKQPLPVEEEKKVVTEPEIDEAQEEEDDAADDADEDMAEE